MDANNRFEFSPMTYGTDMGPVCANPTPGAGKLGCGERLWLYLVEPIRARSGAVYRRHVTGQCANCHNAVVFHMDRADHAGAEPTIQEVRAAHLEVTKGIR